MTSPSTIHLAHSPDSDDAFMFYALADGQIDTQGLSYVHELQDIETLPLSRATLTPICPTTTPCFLTGHRWETGTDRCLSPNDP